METPEECEEICSKSTIKIPDRRSSVFIVNFEQILHIVLVFPLFTLNKQILARVSLTNIFSRGNRDSVIVNKTFK